MPFTYVASPYSHPDPTIRQQRFVEVGYFCQELMNGGITPYSPILHWHEFARVANLATDAETWKRVNFDMLSSASWMIVCGMDGWEKSIGVQAEINFCHKHGLAMSIATHSSATDLWTLKPLA